MMEEGEQKEISLQERIEMLISQKKDNAANSIKQETDRKKQIVFKNLEDDKDASNFVLI